MRSTIMKKVYYLLLFTILSLFAYQSVYANVFRHIRIGNVRFKIVDSGDQGEVAGSHRFEYTYYDNWRDGIYSCNGYHLASKNWKDENGVDYPVRIANNATASADEVYNTMPLPDDEGITLRRYFRYQPPTITVDGYRLDDPFPRMGDEVAPDKIPGTADVMIESFIRTQIGIDINQRVLAWSQYNHDDYAIWDWTFTNTGNLDLDDEVELPTQTLNDLYFMRETRPRGSGGRSSWRPEHFFSAYGEYPGDSLRMVYSYSARRLTAKYDDTGAPHTRHGFLGDARYDGESHLHVDKSPTDETDDITQPQMTGVGHPEWLPAKHQANLRTPDEHLLVYELMSIGEAGLFGTPQIPQEETYPGTHHTVRMEDRVKFTKDLGFAGRGKSWTSCGPYQLGPGENIRIVWADLLGVISPEIGFDVGNKWVNKIDIEPPPGMVFGVTDNMSPQYINYPELYAADDKSSEYNNWAKNCWVFTGRDTLFKWAGYVKRNFDNGYEVPIAPPPPSIEVNSRPDRVEISWGNESESASDFAGYRVYRAIGNPGPKVIDDKLQGLWELIFECGQGAANALTHSYDDIAAKRGQGYYYYVSAFDDGVGNIADVNGKIESLESGRHLNMTSRAAYLTRIPGTSLDDIRVVPNPFNIGALEYVGEPDKIMFLDIPGYCTIKIYSESGDLVKTLEHTDGSGDQAWGDLTYEHSVTETGQLIVSGIYIALIEENNAEGNATGNTHFVKFVVVR